MKFLQLSPLAISLGLSLIQVSCAAGPDSQRAKATIAPDSTVSADKTASKLDPSAPTTTASSDSKIKSQASFAAIAAANYEDAMAEVDKAKALDANLKEYPIGTGYNVLTGERTPTCLEPSTLRTIVSSPMEISDSYSVAHDYKDLYNKLETQFGADIGGGWQIFTGTLSFKTSIMKEAKMTSDDIVILAGYTYKKDFISMQSPGLSYASFFQDLSLKNKDLFRKYCGDRYTKDVTVGATMQMVFTAKKLDSSKWDQTKVDAAVQVKIANIINVGTNVSVSPEQKTILNSYSFSMKCYSLGTSSDVCANYGASTALDLANDEIALQKKILTARQAIAAEVKEGKYLTIVKETMVDYDVPLLVCTHNDSATCPSRWSYFTDYRNRLAKVKELSLSKTDSEEVCQKTPFWEHRCGKVAENLDNAIASCRVLSEECPMLDEADLNIVLSAKNPGTVELWQNKDFAGNFWSLDFRNLLNGNTMQASTFYSFADIGQPKANNAISSIRSHLLPGWTVRFFKETSSTQRGEQYDVTGALDIPLVDTVWKGSNDQISSFELVPPADL